MMLCHHEREYHDYERRKEKKYHSWFSSLNQRTTPSHRIGPFKRTDYCTQNAPYRSVGVRRNAIAYPAIMPVSSEVLLRATFICRRAGD